MKFTDIDVDGIVTLQLVGPGLNQLDHLMNIINETYEVSDELSESITESLGTV